MIASMCMLKVVSYSCVMTQCTHLQSIEEEAACSSETSVTTFEFTRCHNLNFHRRRNVKRRVISDGYATIRNIFSEKIIWRIFYAADLIYHHEHIIKHAEGNSQGFIPCLDRLRKAKKKSFWRTPGITQGCRASDDDDGKTEEKQGNQLG
jgi:hypothetical protein